MSERARLLNKISAVQFAALELHLFLDTHPSDEDAMKKQAEYKSKFNVLTKEFEEKFGPLRITSSVSNQWEWVNSPWPWEIEEDI
jgi:hypothetical protein